MLKFRCTPFAIIILFVYASGFCQEPKLMLPIGHTGKVESVAFSPDGKKIASVSRDNTIKIWDGIDGKLIMTLNGHCNVHRLSAIKRSDIRHG